MPEISCADVPILAQTCSDAVREAAETLVMAKIELDRLGRSRAGSLIVAQAVRIQTANASLAPYDFLCDVLPFFKRLRSIHDGKQRTKALAPTAAVIGDSWRWRPEHLNATERAKAIAVTYERFVASEAGHARMECPVYFHVASLGLLAAHEGKNRVALFRSEGIEHIPAVVVEEDYPHPDRLRLFRLEHVNVAVLDNRIVEEAPRLHLCEELFKAYGLAIETAWPDDYPALDDVLAALRRQRYGHDFQKPNADLEDVRAHGLAEDTEIKASLLNLASVRLPSLRHWLQLSACLLLLLAGIAASNSHPKIQILLAALAGAVLAVLMMPSVRWLRCRIGDLREEDRQSALRQLKSRHVTEGKPRT